MEEDSDTCSILSDAVSMNTLTDDSDFELTAAGRLSQQPGIGLTLPGISHPVHFHPDGGWLFLCVKAGYCGCGPGCAVWGLVAYGEAWL